MGSKGSFAWDHFPGRPELFKSFLMGGFECSTFRRPDGKRLDVIRATRHDELAKQDYERLTSLGIYVAREGIRWHLAEPRPFKYDFSSVVPIVEAAQDNGTQIIWDLCHFGWPDGLDILSPEVTERLAAFGRAFARWLLSQGRVDDYYVPVNEISFFSWAGGEVAGFAPALSYRGFELKCQLVRASIATCDAIWAEHPKARIVHCEPVINVLAHPDHPEESTDAATYHLTQYQAWDLLSGRMCPELGGDPKYLDILGVNFYPHNQWFYNLKDSKPIRPFEAIKWNSTHYKPFSSILQEVHHRYNRPLFISETGAENKLRSTWFRYIFAQTLHANALGCPVHGICLYPIVNHPGWMDDRHCLNGLWDYPEEAGERAIYQPLADELIAAQKILSLSEPVDPEFLVDGINFEWDEAEASPPPQPVQAVVE